MTARNDRSIEFAKPAIMRADDKVRFTDIRDTHDSEEALHIKIAAPQDVLILSDEEAGEVREWLERYDTERGQEDDCSD